MTNFFGQVQIVPQTRWEKVKYWWYNTRLYRWIFRKKIARFDQFTFPIIKRVFPEFVAKDFVAVQPMSMPSAQVFYLDFKHGEPNTKHYQQV